MTDDTNNVARSRHEPQLKAILCAPCGGTGWHRGEECEECDGAGEVEVLAEYCAECGYEFPQHEAKSCDHCEARLCSVSCLDGHSWHEHGIDLFPDDEANLVAF